MKRILIISSLISLISYLSPAEESAVATYRWRATASGGILAPNSETNVASARVYLFDANTISPSNLVANLRGGASMLSQPFVLAPVPTVSAVTNGELKTTASFTYPGEPIGTDWGAYMAIECTVDGSRYAYVTETVPVTGTELTDTIIAFGKAGPSTPSEDPEDETYDAPRWYKVAAVAANTLSPGIGESERPVAAADETAAKGMVEILSPDTGIVSNEDYAKYFKLTATPQSEGVFLVKAELDAEAIELDKSTSDVAAKLSELAEKQGTSVTVEISSKAGLWYRILTAAEVQGPYVPGEARQATGDTTQLEVTAPEGDKAFFKVDVSAEEPAPPDQKE